MAQMIGIARIGRDAEVRYTAGGEAVAALSLAFSYGKKGQDGKQPTQWVDASVWGKRAESLAPYLLKGQQVYVVLDDAHVETFHKRDGGEGHKLAGRVSAIEFAGPRPERAEAPRSEPAQRAASKPAGKAMAFDDMDDDIPF